MINGFIEERDWQTFSFVEGEMVNILGSVVHVSHVVLVIVLPSLFSSSPLPFLLSSLLLLPLPFFSLPFKNLKYILSC